MMKLTVQANSGGPTTPWQLSCGACFTSQCIAVIKFNEKEDTLAVPWSGVHRDIYCGAISI